MRAFKYPQPDLIKNEDSFLNVSEAADLLRTTKVGIYNLVSRKRIAAYKPFGQLLFKKTELLFYVESSRK